MGFKGSWKPKKKIFEDLFVWLLCIITAGVMLWSCIAYTVFWVRNPGATEGEVNPIDVMTFGWTAED